METVTLILHGWSDCSSSFTGIKSWLIRKGVGTVKTIVYGDYQSREDSLGFNDVIDGLNDQLIAQGFIGSDGCKQKELNVIVHSTGGLVIRHWIWRYYQRDGDRLKECPVKRIVMLAPANFGSPLAHRGKSFLGMLFKGRWKIGDFLEVGRQLLDGLELGSPYQWTLAHRDLLGPNPFYHAAGIQVTVLVGINDYTGLRGWVNKPGTDGTVVIAGTPLNSAKLVLDVSRPVARDAAYKPFEWTLTPGCVEAAFGVLKDLDHGSIVDAVGSKVDTVAGKWVLRALSTHSAKDFEALRKGLSEETEATYSAATASGNPKARYQQFLIRMVDDQGEPVRDYTLEFFIVSRPKPFEGGVVRGNPRVRERDWSDRINKALLGQIHTHGRDSSHRRLLVDVSEVRQLLKDAGDALGTPVALSLRVYVPRVDKGIHFANDRLENVVLLDPEREKDAPLRVFFENTTTLIEIHVDRINNYVSVSPHPRKQ
jgi:hypothetical protein